MGPMLSFAIGFAGSSKPELSEKKTGTGLFGQVKDSL